VDDAGRVVTDPIYLQQMVLDFYEAFLGTCADTCEVPAEVFEQRHLLTADQGNMSLQIPSYEEIKDAVWSIPETKAPEPDRFASAFFEKARHIIGTDICHAVQGFFHNGKCRKAINSTLIHLCIAKVDNPSSMQEYCPMACCVLYKVIAKLLVRRLQLVLRALAGQEQGAFAKRRNIQDNILLAQERVHKYRRKHISPKAMPKVGIKKAYDMFEWIFILRILEGLDFQNKFVNVVLPCLTSSSLFAVINGQQQVWIKGSRDDGRGIPYALVFSFSTWKLCAKCANRLRNTRGSNFTLSASMLN